VSPGTRKHSGQSQLSPLSKPATGPARMLRISVDDGRPAFSRLQQAFDCGWCCAEQIYLDHDRLADGLRVGRPALRVGGQTVRGSLPRILGSTAALGGLGAGSCGRQPPVQSALSAGGSARLPCSRPARGGNARPFAAPGLKPPLRCFQPFVGWRGPEQPPVAQRRLCWRLISRSTPPLVSQNPLFLVVVWVWVIEKST